MTQEELDKRMNALSAQAKQALSPIHKEMQRVNAQRDFIIQEIADLRQRHKQLGCEFNDLCDKAAAVKLNLANAKNELYKAFKADQQQEKAPASDKFETLGQRIGGEVSALLKKVVKADSPVSIGFTIGVDADGNLKTVIRADDQDDVKEK